jgi:hypothetical protein
VNSRRFDLLRKADAPHQIVKARIGTQRVKARDNGIRPNRVTGQAAKRQGAFNPFAFQNTGSVGAESGACTTGYWNCGAFADPNPQSRT